MILFRYLVKEIFQAMTAVTVVLLLIVMSGRLAKYLGQAVAGELAADVLIKVMLYRIPDFLPLILPLALFVGVLLAYGRLYAESEMIVMSACGTSRRRLALITLVPSLFVAGLVACLTLWIAPAGLAEVQGLLDDPDNVDGLAVLTPGRFQASPSGRRLIYVESLSSDKDSMTEVFLLDRREQGAQASLSLVKARVGTVISSESSAERYFEGNHGHA
ncbi:LptF/LptG family permease, partial [bacterium]|nr:LptF/LptG family permease [bacterium]